MFSVLGLVLPEVLKRTQTRYDAVWLQYQTKSPVLIKMSQNVEDKTLSAYRFRSFKVTRIKPTFLHVSISFWRLPMLIRGVSSAQRPQPCTLQSRFDILCLECILEGLITHFHMLKTYQGLSGPNTTFLKRLLSWRLNGPNTIPSKGCVFPEVCAGSAYANIYLSRSNISTHLSQYAYKRHKNITIGPSVVRSFTFTINKHA